MQSILYTAPMNTLVEKLNVISSEHTSPEDGGLCVSGRRAQYCKFSAWYELAGDMFVVLGPVAIQSRTPSLEATQGTTQGSSLCLPLHKPNKLHAISITSKTGQVSFMPLCRLHWRAGWPWLLEIGGKESLGFARESDHKATCFWVQATCHESNAYVWVRLRL